MCALSSCGMPLATCSSICNEVHVSETSRGHGATCGERAVTGWGRWPVHLMLYGWGSGRGGGGRVLHQAPEGGAATRQVPPNAVESRVGAGTGSGEDEESPCRPWCP